MALVRTEIAAARREYPQRIAGFVAKKGNVIQRWLDNAHLEITATYVEVLDEV